MEPTAVTRGIWTSNFSAAQSCPAAEAHIDYGAKHCGIGEIIHLTDDMDADMRKIMAFYQTKTAKFPEKFSVDQNHA